MDVKQTLMGAAAGLAMGVAGYALSRQNVSRTTAAAALLGGGAVLGAAASGWQPSVGAGIAGGGAALAAGLAIAEYYAQQEQAQTSGLGARARQMAAAGYRPRAMGAVRAPVGARQLVMSGVGGGELGAIRSQLSPQLQADLNGLA